MKSSGLNKVLISNQDSVRQSHYRASRGSLPRHDVAAAPLAQRQSNFVRPARHVQGSAQSQSLVSIARANLAPCRSCSRRAPFYRHVRICAPIDGTPRLRIAFVASGLPFQFERPITIVTVRAFRIQVFSGPSLPSLQFGRSNPLENYRGGARIFLSNYRAADSSRRSALGALLMIEAPVCSPSAFPSFRFGRGASATAARKTSPVRLFTTPPFH